MAQVLVVNVLYVVLDIVLTALGLLVVMRWGKIGVMGKFISWVVLGFIAYAIGDALWIVGTDLELLARLAPDTPYEFRLADAGYLLALTCSFIAISYPVRYILKAPKEPAQEIPGSAGPLPPTCSPPGP